MRLFPATAALCALLATSAFAVDPVVAPADAAPEAKKIAADPVVVPVDAAAPAGQYGPQEQKPVVVPERPLSDTSASAAERARLNPEDSDAVLDKKLGLSPTIDDPSSAPDALGYQLIKTLFALALVVGIIYLTLNYGLRRLMGLKAGPLGGRSGVVDVVERIPLEQRRTLFVVKAAGEYLLVGTSEGGMTLISKLDTAEVERIQREQKPSPLQLSPFFQKLLSGQKKRGPPPQA